ncbi:MAG: FKBP-type peptidyl-prolyl cis-trans isomerase [Puniceicoccales bacterium]|jgi:FKBP-type peptidyl-prolyl cis-trans isomerase|nr:FKBP-type peptidyl-prolyl cis-trans isomerase [Puniceicoccales bacterium]
MLKELKNGLISSVLLGGGFLFSANPSSELNFPDYDDESFNTVQTRLAPGGEKTGGEVPLTKEQTDTFLKTIGFAIASGGGLSDLGLNPTELELVCAGFRSGAKGEESLLSKEEDFEKMESFFVKKVQEQLEMRKESGKKFLETKSKEPGIQKTASGLLYKIIKVGDAVRANSDCTLEVDYEGKLIDGKVFDSSYERKEKASLHLGSLVSGVQEVLPFIGQGGEIQAFLPPDLGYGDQRIGPVPGGSTLEFRFEIHKITDPKLVKESAKELAKEVVNL